MRTGPALAILLLAVAAQAAQRPNVVLIYTDDQGYGDVSCLNPSARFQTPNLDRLAAEGLLFTDAHSSDTVCTPSRYGLLTGRYSWRTRLKRGVMGAEGECLIAEGRMTLASLLRSHGYTTAMVGKWHLGMVFPGEPGARDWTQPVRDTPLDKGFNYFYGIPASMNYGVLAWFEGRFAATPPTQFTHKKPNRLAFSDYRIVPPYDSQLAGNAIEVAPDFVDRECLTRFTDKAIDWIQARAEDARAGRPFFLYLPYTSPHKPVIPIERFRGKSDAGAYGDFVMETDWHVGRILQVLDRHQLASNTLVIVTSDNGPENTWRQRIARHAHHSSGVYRGGKRSIYEGGHRVPMLVRWPEKIAPGRRWDRPVCQTDLLATLAEMLGCPLPADAGEDSVSFYRVLVGDAARQPPRLPIIHHAMDGRFAIRDGNWKLVLETEDEPRELYHLDADPAETNDLAARHAEIVRGLVEKITAIVTNGRTTPGAPQENDTPAWGDLTWIEAEHGRRRK